MTGKPDDLRLKIKFYYYCQVVPRILARTNAVTKKGGKVNYEIHKGRRKSIEDMDGETYL